MKRRRWTEEDVREEAKKSKETMMNAEK